MKHALPFLLLIATLAVACINEATVNRSDTALSTALSGKRCMNRVIAIDDSLGRIRNVATENEPMSAVIRAYAAAMQEIDYRNCPEEFRAAFEKHRKAWLDMTAVTDQHQEMRGEMHALFDRIEASEDSVRFKVYLEKIWSTWAEVEKAMSE